MGKERIKLNVCVKERESACMREIERHKEEELPLDNRAGEHTEKGSKGRNTPLGTVVLLVLLIQAID